MRLHQAFCQLVENKRRPQVHDIDLTEKDLQIDELLAYIDTHFNVASLYILELPVEELEKLLSKKDPTVVASAAYTLLNLSVADFGLSNYV